MLSGGKTCNNVAVQFSSVAQSCPTLCNPMNRSTPDHPVDHQLPEFTQTHVNQVSDAIQPSHPLSSPSPPAPIPPSIRVFSSESTLHMRWPKYWSFSALASFLPKKSQAELLQNGLAGSPCGPGDAQEASPTDDSNDDNHTTFIRTREAFAHFFANIISF